MTRARHRAAHRTVVRAGVRLPCPSPRPHVTFPFMSLAARRRVTARVVLLDRSLERLPLFRLSDSADDSAISCSADDGGRWRVLPSPGDRLPGTFDQDVYVELMHRLPRSRRARRTVQSPSRCMRFFASMGRQVDGRTYEQLRGALTRLERTTLESAGQLLQLRGGQSDRGSLLDPQLGRHRATTRRGSRSARALRGCRDRRARRGSRRHRAANSRESRWPLHLVAFRYPLSRSRVAGGATALPFARGRTRGRRAHLARLSGSPEGAPAA